MYLNKNLIASLRFLCLHYGRNIPYVDILSARQFYLDVLLTSTVTPTLYLYRHWKSQSKPMIDLALESFNRILHSVHSCGMKSWRITYTISQIYESHVQFYQYLSSAEVVLRRVHHITLFYEAEKLLIFLTYMEKFSSYVTHQKTLDQFLLVSK
jgi:hypothetical protein